MGDLTITNKVLERYINFLLRFDKSSKKKMITKLTNSLEKKEEKSFTIKSIFGAWQDDRSADDIIDDIRESRMEPKDIDL
ncbi:MAG: hypothetical protein B6I18_08560 [Bacteroidetes bacterium 4572_112]|nr:MAG: hypothetical protein B6I18_08560 [Bacteroidetes bacterium 4572_112]